MVLNDEDGQRSVALCRLGFVMTPQTGYPRDWSKASSAGVTDLIKAIESNVNLRVVWIPMQYSTGLPRREAATYYSALSTSCEQT